MNQTQPILAKLAVKNQLISQTEADIALEKLGDDVSDASLYEYLESRNLVPEKELKRLAKGAKILATRQKEFVFGAMVVRFGFTNQSVVDLALQQQQEAIKKRRSPQRIGDMLVSMGFLTNRQRNYVLNLQKRNHLPSSQSDVSPEHPENKEQELPIGETCLTLSEDTIMEEIPDEFQILSKPVTILPGLQLQVAEDGMTAYLKKSKGFNRDMPVQELKDTLKQESIVFGIVPDDMLEGFIGSSGFRTNAFKVAKGIPAKGSQQAQIEYFFSADIFKPGELDEYGKTDYKETRKIVQVPKGTLLAQKTISETEDKEEGFDIFGNLLEPAQTNQLLFKAGSGTRLSSDGLKIIADITGRPKRLLSGEIKVLKTYTQEGDVGYKSGHLDYDGDIQIKGSIQSGFRVSGENITAVSAQTARINAQGNLHMKDGLIETTVYAQGDVTAGFIRNSKIRCMGNVIVTGEIVDSIIICSGACSINGGNLISSDVSAKKGLICAIIGTPSSKACRIQMGKDVFVHEELESYKKQIAEMNKKIKTDSEKRENLQNKAQQIQDEMTRLAYEQDTAQIELKKHEKQLAELEGTGKEDKIQDLEYDISCLQKNIQYTEKKLNQTFTENEEFQKTLSTVDGLLAQSKTQLEDIRNQMKQLIQWSVDNPGKSMVRATDKVHSGTKIQGTKSQISIREDMTAVVFTEVRASSGYEIKSASL